MSRTSVYGMSKCRTMRCYGDFKAESRISSSCRFEVGKSDFHWCRHFGPRTLRTQDISAPSDWCRNVWTSSKHFCYNRPYRRKPRFGRSRECLSVYIWTSELNSRSLATEVGGALKKRFASTDSTGYHAAFAAHLAVDDSVHGMTFLLR